MKKKLFWTIAGCAAVLLIVHFVVKRESAEPVPEYVFTYAENHPEDYPTTAGAYRFAALVEEKTNGRIRIIVKAKGELGDEKAIIRQLGFGGVDFTRVSISPLADDIPKLNVLQFPYLYRNSEHMWQILDGELGREFLDAFEGSDMVALSWYDAGARSFYNSVRPIHSPGDMKGLRIRVQESTLMEEIIHALGAIPLPLAYGDVYSGLEKGIIDGAENNWPSYESTGHYEVAGYYTVDEHTRVPEVQLCAKATWEKLSEEDREIIRSCAQESALYERQLWKEREEKSRELVISRGVQVQELTGEEKEKFRAAVSGLEERFCGEYTALIEKIRETGKKEE